MKQFIFIVFFLTTKIVFADSPSIWSGTTIKWLPSGLQVAGMCKTDANGVQTPYVTDGIIKMASGVPGAAVSGTDFEAPLTFSTGLTRSVNTVTVNTSQNIGTLSNLTSDGYVKTGGGAGTLSVQVAPIPLADGGTNSTAAASAGAIAHSDASKIAFSAIGTTGQALISGGTGAPTWYAPTAGSVLFAGTGGILAQDNASLFFDDSNNRLGVGTAAPSTALQVSGVTTSTSFTGDSGNVTTPSFNVATGGGNAGMYFDVSSGLAFGYNGSSVYSLVATGVKFNQNVNVATGTVSAPGIYFFETGTGLYRIGANNIGFSVSGTKLLDMSSTGLGVGAAAGSKLHVSGSFQTALASVAADTTLDATHHTVLVDDSGATKTITLPACATAIFGRQYRIKKMSASNTTVIDGDAAETIDGAATITLSSQYDARDVVCGSAGAWSIF